MCLKRQTDVAVYTYRSQQLEVRWSSSDASSTDSYKIQWKSGSQEFNSSRQLTSSPAVSKEELQSTSVVSVSYTAPTGTLAIPVRDPAGNGAADFSGQAVRNDKVQVTFTSDPGPDNTCVWNEGDGTEDVIEATSTFSEPVVVSGLP